MNIHNVMVSAWSYRKRTARIEHICHLCGEIINIGDPYFNLTFSDTVTPSSEKLSCASEHLDCRAPWYVPTDTHSMARTLSRVKIPKRGLPETRPVRLELSHQSDDVGEVTWRSTDRLHHLLNRMSGTAQAAAIAEIGRNISIVPRALEACLGDKYKMQKYNNLMAELQQLTEFEPDLSRTEVRESKAATK